MSTEKLCDEHKLILITSKPIVNEEEIKIFNSIMKSKLKWDEIIYQSLIHRTMNMLFYNIKKFGLVDHIDNEIKKMFLNQWNSNLRRNTAMNNELSTILKAFKEYEIRAALLKGNLLANLIYPSIATRQYSDIDFLIDLKDVNKITGCLESLGFIQGAYDENENQVIPATRQEIIFQQMNTYELVEFQKKSENEFIEVIVVDLNHDISWKNAPFKVYTADLLDRCLSVKINNVEGLMLNHVDNIVQLATHLYREASFLFWVTDLRDLKIYKFADIFCYIKKFYAEIPWDELVSNIIKYGLEKIVYYSFHYIEMMYGNIVPKEVKDAIRPSDLSYLDEFGIENEQPLFWKKEFFNRLFDVNRVEEIQKNKLKEMDKYISARKATESRFKHKMINKE